MRFKIRIEFNQNDFIRMKNVLDENPSASLELLPKEDFEFIRISPLGLRVDGFEFSLIGVVSCHQPLGLS